MPATPDENSKKAFLLQRMKRFVTKVTRLFYGHHYAPMTDPDKVDRAPAA